MGGFGEDDYCVDFWGMCVGVVVFGLFLLGLGVVVDLDI